MSFNIASGSYLQGLDRPKEAGLYNDKPAGSACADHLAYGAPVGSARDIRGFCRFVGIVLTICFLNCIRSAGGER